MSDACRLSSGLASALLLLLARRARGGAAPTRPRSRRPGGCSIMSRSIIAGAVQDGRIVSQLEYDEMREFSRLGRRAARRACRPDPAERAARSTAPARSKRRSRARPRRPRSTGAARAPRRRDLLAAYPVPLAPARRARSWRAAPRSMPRIAPPATAPTAPRDGTARARHGSAADRLHRPRAGARAQPLRPLPGDRPGPRGHGDAELRPSARRRTAGRSPSTPAASPIPTRSPRQGAAIWESDAVAARPHPRSRRRWSA